MHNKYSVVVEFTADSKVIPKDLLLLADPSQDSIQSYIGCLHEGAEHASEFDPWRISFNFRLLLQNPFQFLIGLQFEVEIKGEIINGSKVTLSMDLQMSQHRIGHLADHHPFKRACYGDKQKNENNPDHDERGRE